MTITKFTAAIVAALALAATSAPTASAQSQNAGFGKYVSSVLGHGLMGDYMQAQRNR